MTYFYALDIFLNNLFLVGKYLIHHSAANSGGFGVVFT